MTEDEAKTFSSWFVLQRVSNHPENRKAMNRHETTTFCLILVLFVSLGMNLVFANRLGISVINKSSCSATLREIEGEFMAGRFFVVPSEIKPIRING